MSYSYIMSVSVSFLDMNWLKIVSLLAPFGLTALLSSLISILAFRRWISPGINEALQEAQDTITKMANFVGGKSAQFRTMKGLEKDIAADIIKKQLPELEAIRLVVSEDTWEKIEQAIEDNPEAIMQLYNKYGEQFGLTAQSEADKPMY